MANRVMAAKAFRAKQRAVKFALGRSKRWGENRVAKKREPSDGVKAAMHDIQLRRMARKLVKRVMV